MVFPIFDLLANAVFDFPSYSFFPVRFSIFVLQLVVDGVPQLVFYELDFFRRVARFWLDRVALMAFQVAT